MIAIFHRRRGERNKKKAASLIHNPATIENLSFQETFIAIEKSETNAERKES